MDLSHNTVIFPCDFIGLYRMKERCSKELRRLPGPTAPVFLATSRMVFDTLCNPFF